MCKKKEVYKIKACFKNWLNFFALILVIIISWVFNFKFDAVEPPCENNWMYIKYKLWTFDF